MLKKILLAVAVIIAAFIVVVALQPADFRIARSAVIDAPPPAVFQHVNNLRKWEDWSPWAKLDPAARSTFEGPEAGRGAIFKWSGNSEVGEGTMTVTDSKPAELVRLRLDFTKPMAATNVAEFTFEPRGPATAVTWSMSGRNNFIARAVCLFMNPDKMVGGAFEQDLANLKKVAEAR